MMHLSSSRGFKFLSDTRAGRRSEDSPDLIDCNCLRCGGREESPNEMKSFAFGHLFVVRFSLVARDVTVNCLLWLLRAF